MAHKWDSGGRLDVTRIVERPLATIITRVSVDHREFLGDTVEAIAAEKAGILKARVPAIVAGQMREALAVIERQAARLNAPLKIAGEDWTATEERGRLVYQDDDGLLHLPAPRLDGRHEYENAGAAIAALRSSGLKLSPAAFDAGDDPGRMAGAHAAAVARTAGGARAPRQRALARRRAGSKRRPSGRRRPCRPRRARVAAGRADCRHVIDQGLRRIPQEFFLCSARRVIAVPIHQDKTVPAAELADIAGRVGIWASARDDVESAIDVPGSLIFIGAAHSHHRLALSCRRGIGRQRRAAAMRRPRKRNDFRPNRHFASARPVLSTTFSENR